MKIKDIYTDKLEFLDQELIISHVAGKTREFILSHPEYKLNKKESGKIRRLVKRRIKHEPLAYILGHKEFYGLDFEVNKNTLIPRPETEIIVDEAKKVLLNLLSNKLRNIVVVDTGTGSGNIIVSLAKNVKSNKIRFFATDISKKTLVIAKRNSKNHKLDKKIKFFEADLLKIKSAPPKNMDNLVITANLPYLSEEIYRKSPKSVRKYEPKKALLSNKAGLSHYERLLKQIKDVSRKNKLGINALLEISPEQKTIINKTIKKILPEAKVVFSKDLAGKWRLAKIKT